MISELWENFPRTFEHHVNRLLETATPTRQRAYILFKTCQREDLFDQSFEEFQKCIDDYYREPRSHRRKAILDQRMKRPIPRHLYEGFILDFHSATICGKSLQEIASWCHNLIRVAKKTNSLVISLDVLRRTLETLTGPQSPADPSHIEFEDFCVTWESTVHKIYGTQFDHDLTPILGELRDLDQQSKATDEYLKDKKFRPTIYLTQTEIDWTLSVKEAAVRRTEIPEFPLSRGPQKQRLIELERAITLYRIVQNTKLPELLKHRENIRHTIIVRCDELIRDKAA